MILFQIGFIWLAIGCYCYHMEPDYLYINSNHHNSKNLSLSVIKSRNIPMLINLNHSHKLSYYFQPWMVFNLPEFMFILSV